MLNLGWIYFEMDQLKQAQKIYERARQINPTAEVYHRLSLVLLKQGKDTEAARLSELAATMAPENPEIQGLVFYFLDFCLVFIIGCKQATL